MCRKEYGGNEEHHELLFASKDNSIFICDGLTAGDVHDDSLPDSDLLFQRFVRGNMVLHRHPTTDDYMRLRTGDVVEIQINDEEELCIIKAIICGFTSHNSQKASYMIHMLQANPPPGQFFAPRVCNL